MRPRAQVIAWAAGLVAFGSIWCLGSATALAQHHGGHDHDHHHRPITWELGIDGHAHGSGFQISRVFPRSPADHAHLHAGEVIFRVNGQAIHTDAEMTHALSDARFHGGHLDLDVWVWDPHHRHWDRKHVDVDF